jgi:amidophosphoribosyltransferase
MTDEFDDHLHEECGVFGIFGDPDAAEKTYLGLYALQHRGQESAGIASTSGSDIKLRKGLGLVWSVFSDPESMPPLKGTSAIGHNRYSTKGSTVVINAQPISIECKAGKIALAHNGTITNAMEIRKRLESEGAIFQTTSDSELLLHLIARSREKTLIDMIKDGLSQIVGSYCYLLLTPESLIVARDPHGFRPLSLGKTDGAYVVASETCAFDIISGEYIRSVEPGEIIVINEEGLQTHRMPPAPKLSYCIFEHIYFSRPDSLVFGEKVDKIRRRLGKELAKESPCEADIVISVPDSGNTAALGYARASGIKYEIGLIRNHYIGRTFIAPHQDKRKLDVRVKLNPVAGVIEGRRVVLVDDSIVRGTTMRQIVQLLRSKGAKEVHVRISSPPICFPCFYGIDISTKGELIACCQKVDEIADYMGADSLAYLSIEAMLRTVDDGSKYCTACFSGNYPTAIPDAFDKFQF